MRHQALTDYRVHQGDILRRCAFVVPVDAEVLVLSPREGAVVEDHVLTVGHTSAVLVFCAHSTHAETHVAHDDIVSTAETHAVAIDGDTLARRRLSSYVEILGKNDARVDADDAADVEDDDAIGLTHGIAQRTCARIIQVGDVIHAACAASRSKAAPPHRARKGQLLRRQRHTT